MKHLSRFAVTFIDTVVLVAIVALFFIGANALVEGVSNLLLGM